MRISFISVVILSITLFGCAKKSDSSLQTMRINISSDPMTLDPRKARDLNTVTVCRMFFDGLTRISKDGHPEMAIAEKVETSEDGLEYVFHLRQALWSNGEPVTSHDFAQSWKAILSPEFPTDIAYQLYMIRNAKKVKLGEIPSDHLGVKTPNSRTLVVHLEQPIPYFLEMCAMASFLPVPGLLSSKNPNWAFDPKTFVGNGPFIMKEWKHNDELLIKKNEKYWDKSNVFLQEVSLVMVSNETEVQMFEDNKLDWAGSPLSTLPVDAMQYLKETDQLKVSPLSGTQLLRLNTLDKINGENNILSLPEFRKALAYAVNREEITEHLLQGGQSPALSFVPRAMGLFEEGYFSNHDINATQILLEEALKKMGMSKELLKPIVISYISSDRNASLAQAIQRQWQTTFDIKVDLLAVETKVFYQKIKQKDFQIAVGSWIADFNDPINFLEVFKYKDASTNNTSWENAKYIELLDQSALCKIQEQRNQLLRAAEAILMDQMPIIPLYHYSMNYLQRNNVSHMALSPIGQIDLRWVHIDSAENSETLR